MLRRTCERIIVKTGQVRPEVTYGVTSLPPQEASGEHVEGLWRGH